MNFITLDSSGNQPDYETDYDTWLEKQIQVLRQGKLEALDIPHLIEELEVLVRGEKSAVESFAYQIILHLLLIDYWSEECEFGGGIFPPPTRAAEWNRRHWRSEIVSFQFELNNRLTTIAILDGM